MFGNLIAAGASIAGGFLNRGQADKTNQIQAQQAELNRQQQEKFAQHSIRWKVEDAERAGIHPIYALGANTNSYAPVSVGTTTDTSLGSAVASAGQDISRAVNATRTQEERDTAFKKTVEALTVQKMGLENDLLASQIKKIQVNTNPPMPSLGPIGEKDKPEDRPNLLMGGHKVGTDPWTSNMQEYSDRYGDEGLPSWLIPPMIMWNDLNAQSGGYWNRKLMGDRPLFSVVPGSLADRGMRWLDKKFGSRW